MEYVFKGGSDGQEPLAALTEFGGKLYGTTLSGGVQCPYGPTSGCGTVFSFDPASGVELVLYAFRGKRDGAAPLARLVGIGSALVGAANDGDACGCGVLFRVNPATDAERVAYSFQGGADGAQPNYTSLIEFEGLLYGTTEFGGAGGGVAAGCAISGCGVIFSFDPKTGLENVVYRFQGGADGGVLSGRLVELGGMLYGTSQIGGGSAQCTHGCGALYSVDPATGHEVVLYGFQGGADGGVPFGGLIAVGGLLYGTTYKGGSWQCRNGCGTVFSFDPATHVKTIVYAFAAPKNGASPIGELTEVAGRVYGVTQLGGGKGNCDGGCGTVFSLDLQTGMQRTVHAFGVGGDGDFPSAGLTYAGGRLFGTTAIGGIYSFVP